MDFNFTKNPDFISLLRQKEDKILGITSNKVIDTDGFKITNASLKSFIDNNLFSGLKLVLIKKDDLSSIGTDSVIDSNSLFISEEFLMNNYIILDKNFNIITYQKIPIPPKSFDARKYYEKLSNSEYVVFVIIGKFLTYFIDGDDYDGDSPFYSLDDYNRFLEKKNVSQINEVFKDYQNHLKIRANYHKFFVTKSQLNSLHIDTKSILEIKAYIPANKHILINKPEDAFREDLRFFLMQNLNVTILGKEFLLDSFKRLDIYFLDESGSELYLIEVKWVGESLHPKGKSIGTSYSANDICPNAITQTLGYLSELHDAKKNIVRAFLAVFDARNEDLPDTCATFDESIISPENVKFHSKFKKIPDFKVVNTHITN